MTYQEAQQAMADNWNKVAPALVNSLPPHRILDCVIAPPGTDPFVLRDIYEKMVDREMTNEEYLVQEMSSPGDLIVYVTYEMQGYIYFIPMDDYPTDALMPKVLN
jgi:hypothetical protein